MDKKTNFNFFFTTTIILWIISMAVFTASILDGNKFTSGLMAIICVFFTLGFFYMAFEKIKELNKVKYKL